jgi:predicted nucleic acid-binding protein
MNDICVDTGFLLGLYVESDQYHEQAQRCFSEYFQSGRSRLVIPWPILYETVSTRFVKNRPAMNLMQNDWKRFLRLGRLIMLSDMPFRDGLIDECFDELNKPSVHARNLSLVDRVIRRALSDVNVRIDALITFNPADFADVCKRHNRHLLL